MRFPKPEPRPNRYVAKVGYFGDPAFTLVEKSEEEIAL